MKKPNWPLINMTLVSLGLLTLAAGVLLLPGRLQDPVFDPLRFPTQDVLNRVDGVEGPAAHVGDQIQVVGRKCNTSGKELGVQGRLIWRSVDPGGTSVEVSSSSAIRPAQPECVEKTFLNPMPPAVVARTTELFEQGYTRVVWAIGGIETPLGPGGVTRTWSTVDLTVVP